uniref:Uncharacterized protein n=1 Tax=Anguilla anguilla TaxID=7936 RepID=A0A0E9WFI1_ANGAN
MMETQPAEETLLKRNTCVTIRAQFGVVSPAFAPPQPLQNKYKNLREILILV